MIESEGALRTGKEELEKERGAFTPCWLIGMRNGEIGSNDNNNNQNCNSYQPNSKPSFIFTWHVSSMLHASINPNAPMPH